MTRGSTAGPAEPTEGKLSRDHIVVCGFGTTGRAAAQAVADRDQDRIVVVDSAPEAVLAAGRAGYATVRGDATSRLTLDSASIYTARAVIVTTGSSTLDIVTRVRATNPTAHIAALATDQSMKNRLRSAGADLVTTKAAADQLLDWAQRDQRLFELLFRPVDRPVGDVG